MAHLFLQRVDLLLDYDPIVLFVGGFVVPPGLIPLCGLLLVKISHSLGIPSRA